MRNIAFYNPNNRNIPIQFLGLNWVRQGIPVYLNLELWFCKGIASISDPNLNPAPATDVRIKAIAIGDSVGLGKEIIDNGWLTCRKTGVGEYVSLSEETGYPIGNMEINAAMNPDLADTYNNPYKLSLKLLVPVDAETVGPVVFGIQELIPGSATGLPRLLSPSFIDPETWSRYEFRDIPTPYLNRYVLKGKMQNQNILDRTGLGLVCRGYVFDQELADKYSMFSFPS